MPKPDCIKLYGKATSINVRKVQWTLAELQQPYEFIELGATIDWQALPELRQKNPNALVPILQEGEFCLWESNSICRYLVRHNASSLMGSSLQQIARTEQWMDWQIAELNPAWRYAFMALVRQHPAFTDPQAVRQSLELWQQKLAIANQQLHDSPYLSGEEFSLADIVFALSLNRWLTLPLADKPQWPALERYKTRLEQRPAAQRFCFNGVP